MAEDNYDNSVNLAKENKKHDYRLNSYQDIISNLRKEITDNNDRINNLEITIHNHKINTLHNKLTSILSLSFLSNIISLVQITVFSLLTKIPNEINIVILGTSLIIPNAFLINKFKNNMKNTLIKK